MKKQFINLLLAVTIFHLAACSFPHSSPRQLADQKNAGLGDTLLDDHQTHKVLAQWAKLNYTISPPNQKITFTNKHPYAKTIHEIHSGYNIAAIKRRSKGIGLPVVVQTAKTKFSPITSKAFQSNIHPASLLITKSPSGDLHITLLDPRVTKTYYGKSLKTQKSSLIDYITNDPNNRSLKLKGLLNPKKYENIQGLYLSRPYDKNKIPIVMIHGIFSTPHTFMDMTEKIQDQPDLFNKYQIWYYYYPTGTPWLYTAQNFRNSFRSLLKTLDPDGNDKNLDKTTIVAHSMGGLISRLSLSEPKKTLADAYLGKLDPTFLQSQEHKKIQSYLNYRPLRKPSQVIFLAVPHRGSRIASGIIGWLTEKIISIPSSILKDGADILLLKQRSLLPKNTLKLLTNTEYSVHQLQPTNPSLKALNQMKLPKDLKVHSIIGDIGVFGIRFYSDGVVSYPSSHLDFGSETVIPSSHEITGSSECIQRVIQILREK